VLANREIGGDTEGFGMVFIEAAASGRTSIAGRAGGTGSAVLDGVTGIQVDGESVEEVTAALREMLVNQDKRAQLELAALKRARDSLSWVAVASLTRAIH